MGKEKTVQQNIMLNPHLRVIFTSDDEVLIKHSARSPYSRIIRDEGRTKLLGKVIRGIKGSLNKDDFIAQLGNGQSAEDAGDLVDYLLEEKVLVPAERDTVVTYMDTIWGGKRSLQDVTIGIIGVGYLGSRIANEMTKFGVGKIIGCDDRQIQNPQVESKYFRLNGTTLKTGLSYTNFLAEEMRSHDYDNFEGRDISLLDKQELKSVFDQSDFVVAALEVFSSKTLHCLNEVALEANKPWISVTMDGSEAYLGPIYIPNVTCCYSEVEIQYTASSIGVKEEYLTYRETLDYYHLNDMHLVLPPFLETAASMSVLGCIQYLLNGESHLVGRCIRYDFERLSVDYEEIMKLPRCPACAPFKPYRHTFL